jgi:protein-export SecD/SecF family membrane protein
LDGDRYEGIKFTFGSAADAQRAINAGIFPGSYKFDAFNQTKHLDFKTKVIGNQIELTILQAASDFPEDSLDRSRTIIEHRINEASSGMAEADVRLDGKGRLNVQLPGISTLQQARDIITATGKLTFRIDNQIVLDGTDMQDIRVAYEAGKGYVINFSFNGEGAKQLERITTENINKKMAVYLDETMLMDPTIQSVIPGGSGEITLGNATKDEVEKDALLMKSGALPVSLRVVQAAQVAPTLGKEIVNQSVIAIIIGICLIMGFMLLFYGIPGLLADAALMIYSIFVLGIMVLFHGVLTLPGIAGFILSMGMAVDTNIILFERVKDEIRNGKRVRPAVEHGFQRAFITVLDCHITVLITAGVLFFLGSGSIQGFAVTLAIGISMSLLTAVVITKYFLDVRIDHDPDRYAKYFGVKEVVKE